MQPTSGYVGSSDSKIISNKWKVTNGRQIINWKYKSISNEIDLIIKTELQNENQTKHEKQPKISSLPISEFI